MEKFLFFSVTEFKKLNFHICHIRFMTQSEIFQAIFCLNVHLCMRAHTLACTMHILSVTVFVQAALSLIIVLITSDQ